jgi:hypothetical protein
MSNRPSHYASVVVQPNPGSDKKALWHRVGTVWPPARTELPGREEAEQAAILGPCGHGVCVAFKTCHRFLIVIPDARHHPPETRTGGTQ